jgi:hypothetical protein
MNLRIALVPLFALVVVGLGTGLGRSTAEAGTPAPAPRIEAAPDADVAPARRQVPLKVLPTVTVVPSREEQLAALGARDDDSLMLGTAVDQAAAVIASPVASTLPRARLGNPFYDFARLRRIATE